MNAQPTSAGGVGSPDPLREHAPELANLCGVESAGSGAPHAKPLGMAASGTMRGSRVYIAGPMTGHPDFNYPEFNKVAASLRALGYHVENPAENPEPPCGTWQGYMRMAIAQLVTCGEIHMLRGWRQSRGSVIEHRLAFDLGLVISGAPA